MDYNRRIKKVIEYIGKHLDDELSLESLSEISCFSKFHFHRIFTGIVGETVNDYIARRKLECAVNLLIFKTDLSITQVAFDSGFSSSANFSKAVN